METLRVMIVDDEQGMRLGVERALSRYTFVAHEIEREVGFAVKSAETGEAGLEMMEPHAPDILLLDHKLPGISGIDVLERMAGRFPDTLVIMITAYASIETAVKATREGAYDFLPKPFTPEELKVAVRKAAVQLILTREARRLAEEKKRVRFEFIRVLGHELKAPIGAVESYLDILKAKTLGDDLGKYDQIVTRSLVRLEQMRKLILDLLDMTKIESGQRERTLKAIDLVEAAGSAIEMMNVQAEERGIAIRLHAPETLPLQADTTELDMILNNLISNAIKYNRDQGTVDVTLEQNDQGGVRIAVADSGIGMSKEEVAKLFGEFVRIRNTKTKNILGSGLGLSILKRLAELYDGDVTVESEPDVGTTFTVTLNPLIPPEVVSGETAGE